MTYTLSPDEIEKVRDLVRLLTNAEWNGFILSDEEARRAIKMAQEIQRFIQ
jgi:hypothetical protein